MNEIYAVGLLLSDPSGNLLVLEELISKPKYLKKAGMRTFPMETKEPGETIKHTLGRLIDEEVGVRTFLEPDFYGEFKADPDWPFTGVLYIYKGLSLKQFTACPKDINEVKHHGWMHPREILNLPADQRRIEVKNVLQTLLAH